MGLARGAFMSNLWRTSLEALRGQFLGGSEEHPNLRHLMVEATEEHKARLTDPPPAADVHEARTYQYGMLPMRGPTFRALTDDDVKLVAAGDRRVVRDEEGEPVALAVGS